MFNFNDENDDDYEYDDYDYYDSEIIRQKLKSIADILKIILSFLCVLIQCIYGISIGFSAMFFLMIADLVLSTLYEDYV